MGCIVLFLKYLLFVFNAACALIGVAMAATGLIYKFKLSIFDQFSDDITNVLNLVPILLITIGVIVFIIAFLGCYGALYKKSCMLMTYAIILIVILVLQIAFAVYCFLQTSQSSNIKEELYKLLQKIYNSNTAVAKETVNFLQENLKCCGLDDPVVDSHCHPYTEGCSVKFYEFVKNSIDVIAIVAASLGGFELAGALVAIWVSNSTKKKLKHSNNKQTSQ